MQQHHPITDNNNNNNNVYFKSLSYTNVLFKLEMNAQQDIFI